MKGGRIESKFKIYVKIIIIRNRLFEMVSKMFEIGKIKNKKIRDIMTFKNTVLCFVEAKQL